MQIENYTKVEINDDLELWINKENVRINKGSGIYGVCSIYLSFNELQDIVNAINGKKVEREVVNVFKDVTQPLTAEHIRKAVKKLKEQGGQL